jgi:hypothetical protein
VRLREEKLVEVAIELRDSGRICRRNWTQPAHKPRSLCIPSSSSLYIILNRLFELPLIRIILLSLVLGR